MKKYLMLLWVAGCISCTSSPKKQNDKKDIKQPDLSQTTVHPSTTVPSGQVSVTLNGETVSLFTSASACWVEDELKFIKTNEPAKEGNFMLAEGKAAPTGKRTISLSFADQVTNRHLLSVFAYFDGQLGEKKTLTPTMLHTFAWHDDSYIGESLAGLASIGASWAGEEDNSCKYQGSKINFTKIEPILEPVTKKLQKYLISGTFELGFDCGKNKYKFSKGTFQDITVLDINVVAPSTAEMRQRLMH
jgi:hypothetical protein